MKTKKIEEMTAEEITEFCSPKSGFEFIIHTVNGRTNHYPIQGEIWLPGGWQPIRWTRDGRVYHTGISNDDLVLKPRPKKMVPLDREFVLEHLGRMIVREKGTSVCDLVVSCENAALFLPDMDRLEVCRYTSLSESHEYSLDGGKSWHKCEMPERESEVRGE